MEPKELLGTAEFNELLVRAVDGRPTGAEGAHAYLGLTIEAYDDLAIQMTEKAMEIYDQEMADPFSQISSNPRLVQAIAARATIATTFAIAVLYERQRAKEQITVDEVTA